MDTLARPQQSISNWLFSQITRCKHTKHLGWLGEQIVKELIPASRFSVYKPKARYAGDLWLTDRRTGELLKVEVKTAQMNKRSRFEFKLRKNDKHGVTDISHADAVIFFCIHPSGLFWFYFIPVSALGANQKSLTLPGKTINEGQYHPYLLTTLNRLPEVIA